MADTPAPTTPPPAPAPAAGGQPQGSPAPVNPKSGGPNMDSAFAGFDSLLTAENESIAAENKAGADRRAAADAEKAQAKPGEQKTPPDPKAAEPKPGEQPQPKPGEQPPVKVKAATLREELERTRTEVTDWKTKYEKLSTEKTKPDPDRETWQKERETLNKEREELRNELKFAAYERSPEYKEKYQQPFLNAYAEGQKMLPQLSFKEPDKLDGMGGIEEAGQVRKATTEDWDRLMAITDEDAANKFIADHFGHNAARVTLLRDKALGLFGNMRKAVEDFKKEAGQRETVMRTETEKIQKETSERWHAHNKTAAEKFPQLFAPDPADQKGNELLTHGQRLTDLAFGVLDSAEFSKLPKAIQDKMVDGKLPPAEMTMLHSAIRNRSAAHDRLVYRTTQQENRIKELEGKLADYEESEPKPGEQRRAATPGEKKKGPAGSFADVDDAFDRLAAGNG